MLDERALIERLHGPNPLVYGWAELWARGEPHAVLDALAQRGMPMYLELSAAEVEDIPAFTTTIGTFSGPTDPADAWRLAGLEPPV